MLSITKENLQRKLDTFKEYKGTKNQLMARLDLEEFICSNKDLVPFLHDLINSGKISPETLLNIYSDYMLVISLKNENPVPVFPKFYNEKIEEQFHLNRDFVGMMQEELKEISGKKIDTSNLEKDFEGSAFRENFDLQRLSNDLLESISNAGVDNSLGGRNIINPLMIFNLSKDGRLHREKTGEEFVMMRGGHNHNILKTLMGSKGKYVKAEDLAQEIHSNASNTRKIIGVLKKELTKSFPDFNSADFIDKGKVGSGYRLNKNIKIIQKD